MATSTYTPGTNDIVHSLDLDLVTRSRVVEPLHIVQNDKVLPVFEISLFKEGVTYACPSGSTVSIRLEKPDKKVVYMDVSGWDSTRHKIYVKTTYQMTSAFGQATAVIEIDTGSAIAQSEPFKILIDRNPVQEGSIESTDEIKSLQGYVDQAKSSATEARGYRDSASTYATNSRNSAVEANSAKTQASSYAVNAKASETNARNSSTAAATSAEQAEDASDLSRSYAVGTNNTIRPNDETDNSKAYSELAQRLTDQANELLEEARRLLEEVRPAGTVTGVKGDQETEFRAGNVNLTPADIGSPTMDDISDLISSDSSITFQQEAELANVTSGDSVAVALGKLSKLYAELDGKAAYYPVTTDFPVTEVGKLMDAKTVSDQFEYNMVSIGRNISTNSWYRILSYSVGTGGYGDSGIVMIGKGYNHMKDEGYILSYVVDYDSVKWNCLNTLSSNHLIDKIRFTISNNEMNLEIHYAYSDFNPVSVKIIPLNGRRYYNRKLEIVSDSPNVFSEYDIPTIQDSETLMIPNADESDSIGNIISKICTYARDSKALFQNRSTGSRNFNVLWSNVTSLFGVISRNGNIFHVVIFGAYDQIYSAYGYYSDSSIISLYKITSINILQ